MPPPSLSMTTMRTGVETSRRAARPPRSWSRPRSPLTIVVGRPLAWAAPIPEETRPSIPLAPRLLRKSASVPVAAQEGLLVADRHARGGVDEVAVAVGAAPSARCRAGSEIAALGPVRAQQPRSNAACAAVSASIQRSGAGRSRPSSPSSRAAQPEASSVGSARRIAAARLLGSFQPPQGSIDDFAGAARRQPGPQRLAGRHLAEAQDEVGDDRAGEVLVAQQQVVGGDDVGAVVRAAAQLRGRLGQDREAGDAGQVGERLAQLRVELAAGDDHAGDRVADVAGHLVEQEGGGLEVDPRHRGQRPPVAARRAPAGRSRSPRPRPEPAPAARARAG